MARIDDLAQQTFLEHAARRLRRLCGAVGFTAVQTMEAVELVERLLSPWGARRIADRDAWRSDICEDGSPFEFSLALSRGAAELRILVEPQGHDGTLAGCLAAGRATLSRLERALGLSLGRFDAIAGLFLPDAPLGLFALWFAVVLRPGEPPMVKVYLNPKVHGDALAPAVVREALRRLGMAATWSTIERATARGQALDDLKYFSLDLVAGPEARVKIYVHHQRATVQELEAVAALGCTYRPDRVAGFCRAMTGIEGPFPGAPIATCLMFKGAAVRPAMTSVYVPFLGHAATDLEASERIRGYLTAHGGDAVHLDRALAAFPQRPLAQAAGIVSYASLRSGEGPPRVTVYLGPELYHEGVPAPKLAPYRPALPGPHAPVDARQACHA